jgi:hypothetical protein
MHKKITRLRKKLEKRGYKTWLRKSSSTNTKYLQCGNLEKFFTIRISDHPMKNNIFIDKDMKLISISPNEHSIDAVLKNLSKI